MIVSIANGGFARLPVADDQLALAAPDRDHRVDRLDAGLHRRVTFCALDYAGGNALNGAEFGVDPAPLPSIGSPSAFTTRPISASPTGTEAIRPVAWTIMPCVMWQ